MKKMVCEICESQKIKKENGVFICQDCGTEYSLEEAKKLLIDIDEKQGEIEVINKLNVNDEKFLKEKLYLWAEILKNIELCRFYYSFYENDNELLWKPNSLNDKLVLKSKGKYINLYDHVKDRWQGYSILFNCDNLINFYKGLSIKYPNDQENFHNIKLLEELNNDVDVIFSRNFTTQILQKKIEEKFMFYEATLLDVSNFPVCKESDGYIWKPFGYVNKEFHPNAKFTLHEYSSFLRDLYIITPKILIYKKKLFDTIPKDVEYKTNIDLLSIQNKAKSFFNDISCQYNNFYKKIMVPIFEEIKVILLETMVLAEKLNEEFVFPLKYRKIDIVLKMIDLLESGNASTWKELVNAYDTYEYRESVKMSFEVLNQKIDNVTNNLQHIRNNLVNINDSLLSINDELSTISFKCSKMISNTEKIKNNTFGIYWELL